jgi:hypothetical protein
MKSSPYITRYFIFLLTFFLLIAVVNSTVDPFGFFNLIRINGFNSPKTEIRKKDKLLKAVLVSRIRPEAVVLGSSRVAAGLNPDHPALRDYFPRYNLAIDGPDIYIIRRYLQHALANSVLKEVVIGLDFFAFNVRGKGYGTAPVIDQSLSVYPDGTRNLGFTKTVVTTTLFSLSAVSSAWHTLRDAPGFTGATTEPATGAKEFYFNGQRIDLAHETEDRKIIAVLQSLGRNILISKRFAQIERILLKRYLAGSQGEYFLEQGGRSSLDELRRIIRMCRNHGVDLRLFVSPVHARLLEVIRNTGLWPVYEQWKRELVRVASGDPDRGEPPVPIWDFSGYNTVTTEDVPAGRPLMKYYYDSSHYRQGVGDMILDRIFGREKEKSRLPADFGRPLTADSVERVLETIRMEQENYRKTHLKDVREIEWLARSANIDRKRFRLVGGSRPVGGRMIGRM